jgi:glycosyltransferase involved in cell wall biosynthesis/Tfp pilus assembly protein PilF
LPGVPGHDFYEIIKPPRQPLLSGADDPRPVIFLTTRTSGTGSIWRIITKIAHRHYRLYGFDWLDGLDHSGVYRLEDTLVAPAPAIVAAQTIWPIKLDPSRYRFIVNARDPRDLLCNLYSWQFEHGNLDGDAAFVRDKSRRALARSVDEYVLKRNIESFFAPILEIVPQVSPEHLHFSTYAMLCGHFDPFIEGLAAFLGIDPSPEIRRSLESERIEKLAGNSAWIGNKWSGADLGPGRFRRELKPATIEQLNRTYGPVLDFLSRHDDERVRETYALHPGGQPPAGGAGHQLLAEAEASHAPDKARSLELASLTALREKDLEQAARIAGELLLLTPEAPNAWALEARIFLAKGDALAAVGRLRQAIALAPEREQFYAMAIDALMAVQKPAAALALCRLMLANGLDPKDILVKRAMIFGNSGQTAAAERCMEKALALDPTNDDDWHRLAQLRIVEGKDQAALQALQSALELRPHRAELLVLFGETAARCGHPGLAKEILAAALWSKPKDPQIQAVYARHLLENADEAAQVAFAAWQLRQRSAGRRAWQRFRKKWSRGRYKSALTAFPAAWLKDLRGQRTRGPDRGSEESRPVRLLLLMDSLNGGGVQSVMLRLAEGFRDAGLEVSLAVLNGDGELRTRAEAIAPLLDLRALQVPSRAAAWTLLRTIVHYFTTTGPGWPLYGLKALLRVVPGVAEALRRVDPDIALSATTRCNLALLAAGAVAGSRAKLVISEHTNLSAVLERKLYQGRKRRRIARVVGGLYACADGVVAVSQGLQQDLLDFLGLSPSSVRTIYNPAYEDDLQAQAARPTEEPWLVDKEMPVCVAIGRISEQKGYDTLLEALALVNHERPLRLLVIGGADKKRHLEIQKRLVARCADLGLADKVKFLGFRSDCPALLSRADLYVLASRYEGFGLTLVEAMALCIPVVSTDCPNGPSEILEHGRFGTLVPPNNPPALARAILQTLAHPCKCTPARARAEAFSCDAAIRSYLALFEELKQGNELSASTM